MSAIHDSLHDLRHDAALQLRLAREDYESKMRAANEARAHLAELESAFQAVTLQAARARRPRVWLAGERRG